MKLLSIVLLLFCIQTINASILINQNPMNITVDVSEQKSFSVEIKNNHDFEIMDFSFTELPNYGFSFDELTIPANQSRTLNFNVLTSSSHHLDISPIVSYKYFVNLPEEVTTYYINITKTLSGGIMFEPNFLIVRKGDTIIWKNNDEISHTISSNTFNQQILSNQSFSKLFDSLGEINYHIDTIYPGQIEVINRTSQEKAHNPNYDLTWNIKFDSLLNPTTISLENSKNKYEVEAQKFKKGLITITNNGSEKAELIELTSNSEWISFNKNEINIDAGEEDWVEYTITPVLFETNQTDRYYNLTIKAKAPNSNELVETIEVFVPFKEITNDFGGGDVATINWLDNVFCPRYPTSFLCNQSVGGSGNGTVIYKDVEVPINISLIDWQNQKRDTTTIKDSQLRADNELKILKDDLKAFLPELNGSVEEILSRLIKNEKKINSQKNTIWIIGFFVLIGGLILYVFKLVEKKQTKETIMEGQYKYKR
jgi:hypothetical protein